MRKRDDLLFPMEEYERRLTDLRYRMGAHGVEALLVTDPEGMHYLTTSHILPVRIVREQINAR